MKECSRCHLQFDFTVEFWHKDSNQSDGWDKQCKTCKAERRRDYYERHAEAEKALVQEWRRLNPDAHRSQHNVRRARKITNGPIEPVSYFQVFQRDRGVCGLCSGDIDKNLKWPDPACGTLDHVIPLSRGGSHTYENVQLAHASCNSSKGNRID